MSDQFDNVPDGAEYHREFYRGKDLTSAFDHGTLSARIADGTFRDIFPGDYIVKRVTVPAVANTVTSTYEVKFIIADLDYALHRGVGVEAHHAVIIPEEPVIRTFMNPTDTTSGGYAASYMNRTVMPAFAQGISAAFGPSHILKFNADGQSSLCRLMTLSMVFGWNNMLPPAAAESLSWQNVQIDECMQGSQFIAFIHNKDLELKNEGYYFLVNLPFKLKNGGYWVSDVCDSTCFAYIEGLVRRGFGCHACAYRASHDAYGGVRPFALLV